MDFEEAKACVEELGRAYGFEIAACTVDDFYWECAWLGMHDLAPDNRAVMATPGEPDVGIWLRFPKPWLDRFYADICRHLAGADLYMCHDVNDVHDERQCVKYVSVPRFSSLAELRIKLACRTKGTEDAAWRALFHRFCMKYGIRCQFCDYGDWSKDPASCWYGEFWFLSETMPECGAGVSVTGADGVAAHNVRLRPGIRSARYLDAANVFRAIAGKRVEIQMKDRTCRVLSMPEIAGSAEEYEILLSALGVL